MEFTTLLGVGVVAAAIAFAVILAFAWRVVVPTNLVHIVQSSKKTTSYGANQSSGNTYYNIPSFVPIFGVTRIVLPVNNFSIALESYEAYDRDRAPFELDVVGFFVITDTNLAAARASSFEEMEEQLEVIMQGAARSILAKHDINDIMGDRATFGDAFTAEVDEGLRAWGVQTVKSLELMDIRDAKGSKIIADIMAKKSSLIETESRTVVAENKRKAAIAEVDAAQQVELRKQEQLQAVGQRAAQQEREVGIAREQAAQEVRAQAKITKERDMAIIQVEQVRGAEIKREIALVTADQERQTRIINAEAARDAQITTAEGDKQQTVLVADGRREAMVLNSQGIEAEGRAKGAAEQALLMAPVNAQILLADKIATSQGYQAYLVSVRQVEAYEKIGIANASALANADFKIIANTGSVKSGIESVSDLLTPKGGAAFGAMLEGMANTEVGKQVIDKLSA
jgi:flotillin